MRRSRSHGGVGAVILVVVLAAHALADDNALVSHWRFDEQGGTTAADTTGSHPGTLAGGAAFVAGGVSGNALSLDRATNSLVNMGNAFPTFEIGDFSIALWVNTTTTQADTLVVAKHEAFVPNGWIVAVGPTGGGGAAGRSTFYASDTQVAQSPTSTSIVNDGRWHHIVGVYSASGTHAIYVDGAPAEAATASQAIIARDAPLLVGGVNENGTPVPRYTGLVDDLQIYSRALSDAEVAFLAAHAGADLTEREEYDLRHDWSDTANPNGPWSYLAGDVLLPRVTAWQRSAGGYLAEQPGWAPGEDGNPRIPFWHRDVGLVDTAHDYVAGDVVVHTGDDTNGTGQGPATVVWTSPLSGRVDVSGAVWMGRDIGRSCEWSLFLGDTLLTQGSVASGDAYDREHPFPLFSGDGQAPAVRGITVQEGDRIRLQLASTSQFGDFVGVELSIRRTRTGSVLATGDAAPGAGGATFASFGPPAIASGGRIAFRGALAPGAGVTKKNDGGIWAEHGTELALVAREGAAAPGTQGTFGALGEPVLAGEHVAFAAKLKGVARTAARGIWSDATGTLALVAQQGAEAPGTTGRFAKFLALGLPPRGGPVFLAKLSGVAKSQALGVFGSDDAGEVAPVLLAGARLDVRGSTKTVAKIAFLPKLKQPAAAGQTRSFDARGDLLLLVTFTDRTTAIVSALRSASTFGSGTSANGHAYAMVVVPGGISWNDASRAAGEAGGHLATITSAEENAFAFALAAARPDGWFVDGAGNGQGPWLGGVQPPGAAEPSGGFTWMTKEPFAFTSWSGGEPNDFGGSENRVQYFGAGTLIGSAWNDAPAGDNAAVRSYLVEFETPPVPPTLVAQGDATPSGSTFLRFGVPLLAGRGRFALAATFAPGDGVSKANDTALVVGTSDAPRIAAREGSPAPDTSAVFAKFGDPVADARGTLTFVAKLKAGSGATRADAAGIWTEAGGALALLARQGATAPGANAPFRSFGQVAACAGGDILFVAKLQRGGAVTGRNDTGIWSSVNGATPELLARTGDRIAAGGSQRTLKSITFLAPAKVVGGQSRGFDDDGDIVYLATFTDGTTAVVRILR